MYDGRRGLASESRIVVTLRRSASFGGNRAALLEALSAQAASNNAVEFCKGYLAEGFELGECVSIVTLGENLDDKGVAGNAYGLRLYRYLRDFLELLPLPS